MQDIPHSLLPFDDALQNISYKHDMRELIRYVLDHLEECSFGMVQRFPERELCELKFTPVPFFFFAMIQRFSSSVALSPTQLRLFYWMEDPIFFIRY